MSTIKATNIQPQSDSDPLVFSTNATERMRIDGAGSVQVGTAISPSFVVNSKVSGTAATSAIVWQRNGTQVGYVDFTGSTVSFINTSDYRLKNTISPITNALASICSLNPVSFKWNLDNINDIGFVAHEVQTVVPLAVRGEKDAVNEDGSIKAQGIEMNKLVTVLVAALKELKEIVDTQATEIAALKELKETPQ